MIYYTTELFLCQDFLICICPRKTGLFLYTLHSVRQGSTTKLWKGVILTNPFGCARINSTGHPESFNDLPRKAIHDGKAVNSCTKYNSCSWEQFMSEGLFTKNELKSSDFMNWGITRLMNWQQSCHELFCHAKHEMRRGALITINERKKTKTPRLLLCRTASARYTCLAFLATRDIASPKTVLNRFCLALHAKMRKNERHTHHNTQLYAREFGA